MNAIQISNVSIRQVNGLYSLNDLHRASGGEDKNAPRRWLQNQQTIDLIEQCEIDGFPSILVKQGVGTFACKELICAYATWISPTFFLQVIRTFLAVQEQGSLKLETQPPTFSQSELRKLATVTYYCAWATQMLRDVAEPLHALGYEKAITMRTLANESRLFLHDTHKALTREMPKIASAFERADMQNSLSRCEFLM